ncbi:hypothetical protein [Methylobrevis albus]|uniref:Uncharacterized protein n=1 Tax=Methylobrevis albus TaxID=2793297 RepID=A0A931I6S0_9HYPH|nr:hypothetical protein [Methylobrevis albus]MBH0239841.1 hypothetical protein [Methylobrevis albus]
MASDHLSTAASIAATRRLRDGRPGIRRAAGAAAIGGLLLIALQGPAAAQNFDGEGGFAPGGLEPGIGLPGGPTDGVLPYAPSTLPAMPGLDGEILPGEADLLVSARLTEDGPEIKTGIVWRIFSSLPGPDGKLVLAASGSGGSANFKLEPGTYFVHCDFGYASATVRTDVEKGLKREQVVLNAGGLKLSAATDETDPIDPAKVRFDIYFMEFDQLGERKVAAENIAADEIVRLPVGTYHVVSRYGAVNATVRADIDVRAGKLTEAQLFQKAAEVTLKLVGEEGGEAIADTHWSILTPGGDIVSEGVGAFPTFVLAAGDYTVVAKHNERVFSRDFNVESGRDGEVEVLTENPIDTSQGVNSDDDGR